MINIELPYYFMYLLDVLDIICVSGIVYYILRWLQGSRAIQLLRGFIIILAVYLIADTLKLETLTWLLAKMFTGLTILFIVVFQSEIRLFIAGLGRNRLFNYILDSKEDIKITLVKALLKAVIDLSETKTGAIIVLEKKNPLDDYIDTGIVIKAKLVDELLISIFYKNNPLHDGAVIIRGDLIFSAGCLLPLTEEFLIDERLGTRHRAAIGLSEKTDALVIVVSEETGTISLAEEGKLTRYIDKEALESRLFKMVKKNQTKDKHHKVLERITEGKIFNILFSSKKHNKK